MKNVKYVKIPTSRGRFRRPTIACIYRSYKAVLRDGRLRTHYRPTKLVPYWRRMWDWDRGRVPARKFALRPHQPRAYIPSFKWRSHFPNVHVKVARRL